MERGVIVLLLSISASPRARGQLRDTYLQYAVYDLPTHIFLVRGEELALEQAEDAFRDTVVGLEVFVYAGSAPIRAREQDGVLL